MKWLPTALLIAIAPVSIVHSGTFLDDFHDRNLDGWHVWYPLGFPVPLAFKNDYLVINTTVEEDELPEGTEFIKQLGLELRLDNSEDWNSYTLTCRIRFAKAAENALGLFSVGVRRSMGHFNVMAEQRMLIILRNQHIQVDTIPPDAKSDPETGELEGTIHRQTLRPRHLRRPLKLNRWIPIKIVAEEQYFEFHVDDNFVTQYEDETAVPGTVMFLIGFGSVVHLDDVMITGPEIPNIGSPRSVNPEARLATTWGEIKNLPKK